MGGIVLRGNRYSGNTIVSNCFIDEYMADANGAQLKIYLYLMRCIEADEPVSVPLLADRFNYTETDIIRSLLYWARKGIVSLEFDEERNVSGIVLNDPSDAEETEVSLPKKPASSEKKRQAAYTVSDLNDFGSKKEVKQLIFATEQYLSRTLNPSDMKTLLFIYDGLGFSTDLLEFLIEYCVGKGKTSMRYIESTAIGWAEAGVKTVNDAKEHVRGFSGNDYFAVLKAFGITDRKPVQSEMEFVDKWQNEYGYELDIILEAAARTMKAIAKPSFPYTDRILRNWSDGGVRSVEEIDAMAMVWGSTAKQGGTVRSSAKKRAHGSPQQSKIHFELERQYDFDELEAEILKKQRSKRKRI